MLKKDITVTFGGQVGRVALTIIATALLARILGPEGRGLFALAMLLPLTIDIFLGFGQVTVNATFAGLYRDQREAMFAQTILFAPLLGGLGMLVMASYLFWLPVDLGRFADLPTSVLVIGMFIIPASMLANMLQSLARGAELIISTVLITTVGAALRVVAIIVFLAVLDGGLIAAVGIELGLLLALIACHIWQVRAFATLDPRKLSWKIMKHALSFGGIVAVSGIAMYLIPHLGMYFMNYMSVPAAEIGLFAVAAMAVSQLQIIPGSVAQAFLPRLSNNPEVRLAQTPVVFRFTFIASITTMLLLGLIGPPAIIILFGWKFAGSIVPFAILLPGLGVFGSFRVLGMYLLVRNKPHYGMVNNWISLGCTTLTSALLIPIVGMIGAAIGSSLGLITLSFLTAFAYRKESGVPLKELVIRKADFVAMKKDIFATLRGFIRNRGKGQKD